jgi:acyl-coenzyme A thioesterase PaaI-like protein
VTAAYFTPDDDAFVPTALANGPWGATISGHVTGGLLGHVLDRDAGDPDFQPARLTVDLLRPAAMTPLTARTATIRNGKRLRLVEAELMQSGTVVARASALFLRRGDQPPGEVWRGVVDMPPLPENRGDALEGGSMMVWTYGRSPAEAGPGADLTEWGHAGPKFVWVREPNPVVAGTDLTPLTRAAMAGDVASSLTHYGTAGLQYINADYTLTLSRLPDGPDIGLAALTQSNAAGVAAGSAALFDRHGQIGAATVTALANPGFSPPQRRGVS